MMPSITRRQLLQATWVGITGWAIGTPHVVVPMAGPLVPPASRMFVHLSDFHWGYRGDYNRQPADTLERAWTLIKGLTPPPAFVVVTGDLIQATDSASERLSRLQAVKAMLDQLQLPYYTVPGEHDCYGDRGQSYRAVFGESHWIRKVAGFTLIGLDNVSQGPFIGSAQRQWLKAQLENRVPGRAVVLSHAPLYDVFLPWNWYTYDGAQVYQVLTGIKEALFLYGHVHQAMTATRFERSNWAGLPLSWPYPEPGLMEPLAGWPQGATHPDMGLGFNVVRWSDSGPMRVLRMGLADSREANR